MLSILTSTLRGLDIGQSFKLSADHLVHIHEQTKYFAHEVVAAIHCLRDDDIISFRLNVNSVVL